MGWGGRQALFHVSIAEVIEIPHVCPMTPSARFATAIEILDAYLAGTSAEKALTNWARGARYAGSKDRAAVRDIVFDAIRCRRSYAAWGGALSGRGLVIGSLRAQDEDPQIYFTSQAYAPASLSEAELTLGGAPTGNAALDCPDWLAPQLQDSLGDDFAHVMQSLRKRADVYLRVNLRKATVEDAVNSLQEDGIACDPHDLSPTALRVTQGARRVHMSAAYEKGWVELQDAASQAVVDCLPLSDSMRILDYCAGGGGKTLAMAGRANADFYAYDVQSSRTRDIPTRSERAGVEVEVLDDPTQGAPYDLVLCDAPCSGSGAWRRSPEGKWGLDEGRLSQLIDIQSEILDKTISLVSPGGCIAYATCSLLKAENDQQCERFLSRHPNWAAQLSRQFTPIQGGDGFFISHLTQVI